MGLFLECHSRMSITFRCIIAEKDHPWFFLAGGRGIMFVTPVRWYRKYHIYMYFLRKIIFDFPPKGKLSCFRGKKNTIFPNNTRKIIFQCNFFEKTIFSEHLKKISYFQVFFWRERSSFVFRPGVKITFAGKRNVIFPDNKRKIMFQRDFFGNIIFSGRLKKKYEPPCGVRPPVNCS